MGGDLPELIGSDFAQKTIGRVDEVYLRFGADTHVEGLGAPDEVKSIRRRAIKAGLKLVDCPIRHLGTEKAQEICAIPAWKSCFRRSASTLSWRKGRVAAC